MSMVHDGHAPVYDVHTFHHHGKSEDMTVTSVLYVRIAEVFYLTHP